MSKHTPGPWTYYSGRLREEFPTVIHEIHSPDDVVIVKWGGFDGIVKRVIKPNARLIAAAPELLAACKKVTGIVETLLQEARGEKAADWGIVNDGLVAIAKAIAKAEGR